MMQASRFPPTESPAHFTGALAAPSQGARGRSTGPAAPADRRRWTLITYDTPSNKRRRRFARTLQSVGRRVQHSVFEAWLTPENTRRLERRLRVEMDPAEDSIFVVPVGGRSKLAAGGTVTSLGLATATAPTDYWIV